MADRYDEYLICQHRGHESNGMVISLGDRTTYKCRHCGTSWYTTTKEHEIDVPEPPENSDG